MISKSILTLLVSLFSYCYADQEQVSPVQLPWGPTEFYFDTLLDHYSSNGQSTTFKLRYIIDAQYWDPKKGPILFYAGNEGDIMGFYNNSGFMTTTLAKEHQALVLFGEHRYFGKSFPFPKDQAFEQANNVYLTVEQAMMDYVELLKFIRFQYNAMQRPCVVFGGSYGGMLAAWLRMKFPSTFQGALASSAPILFFKDAPSAPPASFGDVISENFKNVTQGCFDTIKQGFVDMMDQKNYPDNFTELGNIFNVCTDTPITTADDIDNLYTHLYNGYAYMAMTNYPYSSSFLNPQPGYPCRVACERVDSIINPQSDFLQWKRDLNSNQFGAIETESAKRLQAIYESTRVYFDFKNSTTFCTNLSDTEGTGSLDGAGWDVLACNQLTMPTINGPNSMFIPQEKGFDYDTFTTDCQSRFGLTPRLDFILDYFGGRNIMRDFIHTSNIIFSNGQLDPWMPGGVYVNATESGWESISLFIENAAHHLDLRLPVDNADPVTVKEARNVERMHIKKWINDYNSS